MNKYIIGGNCTGKTRKMLENAKNCGATVVCKFPIHMQDKGNNYGIYGLKYISYEEFMMGSFDNEIIAIDEIGDFMASCFGAKLDSFTMTVNDKECD